MIRHLLPFFVIALLFLCSCQYNGGAPNGGPTAQETNHTSLTSVPTETVGTEIGTSGNGDLDFSDFDSAAKTNRSMASSNALHNGNATTAAGSKTPTAQTTSSKSVTAPANSGNLASTAPTTTHTAATTQTTSPYDDESRWVTGWY